MQAQVGTFVGSELHRIKQEFRQIILSILTVSAKEGLTDSELMRDYRSCTGLNLPYAQLGYNSVYELMRSMPDVCFIRRHSGKNMLLYYPIETEQTREIARLVRGQKDTNRAAREANRDKELRRNMHNRFHSQNPGGQRGFAFVDDAYGSRPARSSNQQPPNGYQHLPHGIQNQIRSILERYDGQEMTVSELVDIYTIENGFMFNFGQYGFDSFTMALRSLTHLIEVEPGPSDPLVKLLKRQDKRPNDRAVPADNGYSTLTQSSSREQDARFAESKLSKSSSSPMGRPEATNPPPTAAQQQQQPRANPPQMPIEEVVEILKKIIDEHPAGIYPTSLLQSFKAATNKSFDFERFGFDSFNDFLTYKLHGHIAFDYSVKFDEPKIYKIASRGRGDETPAKQQQQQQLDMNDKRECLKNVIEKTLVNHKQKPIEKAQFCELFERINGWKFTPEEYGFTSFDEFLAKFAEDGIFSIDFDTKLQPKISYPGASTTENSALLNESSLLEQSSNNQSTLNESSFNHGDTHNTTNRKLLQAEFIQNHIVHQMDPSEILRSFAEKSTHRIIISNVTSPVNFQIQLVENNRALDSLMDELEKLYYGIGASHYNMPVEYIQHHGLCAAVFEGDKNWHRCRITGYYKEQKSVRVQFIDYGGNSIVSLNDVKFLAKQFDKLPIQAANARLHNLAPPVLDTWHKNIVDYMLQKVKGKVFSANIIGDNEGVLSIECFQELTINEKTGAIELNKKSLNQIIIDEAYAKFHDSTSDIEFKDFKTWQESIFKKYATKSNMSGVSESVVSAETRSRQHQLNQKASCVSLGTQSTDSNHYSPSNSRKVEEKPAPSQQDARATLSPVLSQDQDPNASLNNQNQNQNYITVSAETKIRTKQISIQESCLDATYTVLSINGTMYVYWSDLAGLLGVNMGLFKQLIVDRFQIQEADPSVKCLVVKCPLDESNIAFFRLLRSALGISSKEIRQDEGAFFCKYKGIYDLCDLVFQPVHSEFVKSIILNGYKPRSSNDNSSSRKDTLCTEMS